MQYEDPQHHFDRSMHRAADRYVTGLQRAGMRANKKLTRAVAERAVLDARLDYQRQTKSTFESHVGRIMREKRQRDRQINREGARLAWVVCPLAVFLFGACAWLNFHQGDKTVGVICAVGALAFLVMLVVAQWRAGR